MISLGRLLDRFRLTPARYPSSWAASVGADPAAVYGERPSVSQLLEIAAIARAESIISETVAILPRAIERSDKQGGAKIVRNAAAEAIETIADTDIERLMRDSFRTGNGYAAIRRAADGSPEALEVISAWRVSAEITGSGRWRYKIEADTDLDLPEERIASDDLVHFRYQIDPRNGVFGISPLQQCASSATLIAALRTGAASYYKNISLPGTIIKIEKPLNADAAARLKAMWEDGTGGRNRGRTAVLDNGASVERIPFGTAEEAQMSELLREAVREASRLTGVPPSMLAEVSDTAFSSAAELGRAFREATIKPLVRRLQDEMSRKLLNIEERRRGLAVAFDLSELGRADGREMAETNARLLLSGVLTANEIRASLNYPSHEDGDTLLRPSNMVPASEPAPDPAAQNPLQPNNDSTAEPGPGGKPLAQPINEEPQND
jgi:HK97 family phage portal protein